MASLSPNNEVITKLIGDYSSGGINMIYGNAASGKTTTCLLAVISAATGGKIIYIDTENGFNTERLEQLYGKDISKITDKIFLMKPGSLQEQGEAILNAKKLSESTKIQLVIVDTIAHHYRGYLKDSPKEANQMMAEQMANLTRISRDYSKIVIATNQVYSKIDTAEGISMVGGTLITKFCKTIIEFNKMSVNRFATVIKNKENESLVGIKNRYTIKNEGLFLC